MAGNLIEAKGLCTYFPIKEGIFQKVVSHTKAVDGVDFSLSEGQIVSVVGESGCGKSTLGNSLLGLVQPTAGELSLEGKPIDLQDEGSWKPFRHNFQIIFQDPYSSLNPRQTILEILREPMRVHKTIPTSQQKEKVAYLLEKVGLSADYMYRYPHAFSGGQRQRIGIARVLGINPKVIVCDEIVSALDVSVQAQIIRLLLDLKSEFNLSLLFIAHDLSLVKLISDSIYVMYLGRVVEKGTGEQLFNSPKHPYTKALIGSIPTLNRDIRPTILEGEVGSPREKLKGCAFASRCPKRAEKCTREFPQLKIGDEHPAACFYPEEY